MNVNENDEIYEFEEKPENPKSNLASMGIYIFTWAKLREFLIEDESDKVSSNDFGQNIIPAMLGANEKLVAYRFAGYWKDVGTISSLWDANMDMLSTHNSGETLDDGWPIHSRSPVLPPHFTGEKAEISHSVVTGGCEIYGTVENSVVFHSVIVEEGAKVNYSILMPGTIVKSGAVVEYSIVAEKATIHKGATLGSPPDINNPAWGITVIAGGTNIGAGAVISAGAIIRSDVEKGDKV